jgi:glycosyltransferase involved in cell wall biosynthesis
MKQSANAILTIILAVKDANEEQFNACLGSIVSRRNSHRFDLVIVSSGFLPAIDDSIRERLHNIVVIKQEPQGVYNAYNRGLDETLADYVLFLGVDDLILPGLDNVIESISFEDKPSLVAACSLMQGIGISKPSKMRWARIFRNWCQQGLLYRSDIFSGKKFDTKYKMQADHKFNMELVSNPNTMISYRNDIITRFSTEGLSQRVHDWKFRADMPSIARSCYGDMFWIIALIKRKLADIIKGWPNRH